MSFHAALPPWLVKAVEDAGEATVILKPGDRPFVIKSRAPYHLGTQAMTTLTMEGLAQQILSDDAQQALSKGQNVEETLKGDQLSVTVNAVRMDHDIVIKLRNAQGDEIAQKIEEETRIINAKTAAALRAAATPEQSPPAPIVEPSPASPRALVQNAAGETVADIELPLEEDAVDTFIARLSPAAAPAADGAANTQPDEPAAPPAGRTSPFARLSAFFNSSAAAIERHQEEAARREQEDEARLVKEEAVRREQEETARREQEEAARREQEETARREQEETARREQEETARREREEAARREQEEAARREQEETARREREEAARREQDEAAQRAREDAARQALEETIRREREEAARRELEETARAASAPIVAPSPQPADPTTGFWRLDALFSSSPPASDKEGMVEPLEDKAVDTVISKRSPAAVPAAGAAASTAPEQPAPQPAGRTGLFGRLDSLFGSSATAHDKQESARREQEEAARREQEEAARREQEDAARREQEEAARRVQEEATRREQEEAARREQEEAARREQEEAARREQEEAARREQEEAARREQEEAARREQEEAARRVQEEAVRREQEEAARRAQEEATRREQEEAARREQEEAARREQEEAARREQEEAARREQEEAARREQEEAARREQEEAARREQEEAARREQEEAARREQEEAARREQEEAARREQEEAARRDLEEAARRARQEADAVRGELAEATRRAQEEAAQRALAEAAHREQEEATRRELEESARRARQEADAVRHELQEVTRRAQEEAAQRALAEAAHREQEEAARRALEETEQRAREDAARQALEETIRREREDAARQALEEAMRREQEDAVRRAQEEAIRREQEEAAQRAREDAARQALEEAVQRAQDEAARREQDEADRRAQEDAAQRELEHVARRIKEEAARRAVKDAASARATVVELSRRGPLAVATTELTDWILEAMHQGATALYLRAGKAPFARIDGQVEALAVEPIPLSMFERAGATMRAGEDGWEPAGEWAWSKHIPGTGSVHCQAFSDGQGGGFIVQLPVSVAGLDEQVPRHIRNACETGEGLIVVSAPFAGDVAAMVGAVVAWSAHRRPGHIISFGTNGSLERVAGNAFISDRPLPAGDQGMMTALHAALRERPDMLVAIASGPLPAIHALVSAAAGRLVIVGVVARTAPRALEALLNELGPNRHLLAATFKAACSWRGFRTAAERRLVISDTLVATDRVRALIEAGDIAGLHLAQVNRDDGMRGVDEALAAAVARKKITLREAAACAVDRKSLISLVRRQAHERRAAERLEQDAHQRASVLRTINGV